MRTRVFTDADNTLWDTDAVYARAQIALATDIHRIARHKPGESHKDADILAFVRKHDQHLANSHSQGLRYPALLLAEALYDALGGSDSNISLDGATKAYSAALADIPELRPGVRHSLRELAAKFGVLTVVTESSAEKTARLLAHYGLQKFVREIVSERKTQELYASLRDARTRNVMIGDQLDRDIAFSQAAQFEAVHFPGNFAPEWLAKVNAIPHATIDDYGHVERYLNGVALNSDSPSVRNALQSL